MPRALADMRIEDCDEALALLQSLTDEPGLREVARLSIDDVLDRRNELVAESAATYPGWTSPKPSVP